jgi:hypothetical protein
MNKSSSRSFPLICFLLIPFGAAASNLDTIGLSLLQVVTTNLNGSGVRVAQPEGGYGTTTNWEVNPAAGGVGQPASLFTYFSSSGTTNYFPNAVGGESGHADAVAGSFYGIPGGVATNVAHVDNYYAGYFVQVSVHVIGSSTNYTVSLPSTNINDPVVNQSFVFLNSDSTPVPTKMQQAIDTAYDNYAAQYNALFVSGIGNGGAVNPPGTGYNGIGVGAYGGSSSVGPSLDNGRCKPDITAPAAVTSFSTPQVAGAAAVLLQAGLRGDGGSDTSAATNSRTVKALLLNGAVKPAGWTNGTASPLDARYGAGVLNVFNAYEQLAGRKQTNLVTGTVSAGAAHPPTGATNTIGAPSGWSYTNLTSSSTLDAVAHYYFNLTNGISNATFTATATLVWNRQQNQSSINNLQLFLYNTANSNLVAVCTSAVDNVQHLFVPSLPRGRYDLQVLKKGGTYVTPGETYALAYEFFSMTLSVTQSGPNLVLRWPVYPAGFTLESTTNLISPALWTTNHPAPAVTNNQNYVVLNATNRNQFFRLRRP